MSDISEAESESLGYLAEGIEEDAASDDDDGLESDASESRSGTDDAHANLVDWEAEDTDEESSMSGESSGAEREPLFLFPQFKRLPIELRHRIWEFFCPDLTARSRVYDLKAFLSHNRRGVDIVEGPFLEQQTRPARDMLAVHHESRQLALKAFPDTLPLYNSAVLRFNAHRDVIALGSIELISSLVESPRFVPGFSERIRQLGVTPTALTGLRDRCRALFRGFSNLQTVYLMTEPTTHAPGTLRWCVSDKVNLYSVATFEERPGLGEDATHLFCWPDLERHRDFALKEIAPPTLALRRGSPAPDEGDGREVWFMIQFLFDSGLRRFEQLQAWNGEADQEWESSSGEEDDGEPDEYESEGIDDSDLGDDGSESPSDDLHVLDDEESDQDEHSGGDASSTRFDSPDPADDSDRGEFEDGQEGVVNFSSPDESSATLQGPDAAKAESESDQPVPHRAGVKRRRGRIVASESDEDSESVNYARKRIRTGGGHNPVVVSSDDDDEEQQRIMRANRRARAVLLEGEEVHGGDDDTGSEREGGGTRALSLAEKLQLHREQVPIPPSDDDDDPDVEEMGGDDYDARDYADFQDDDEDDDVSDQGDLVEANEFIVDDDDGNGEDDDGY